MVPRILNLEGYKNHDCFPLGGGDDNNDEGGGGGGEGGGV